MPMQSEIFLSGENRLVHIPLEDVEFYEKFLKMHGIEWAEEQKNENYVILSKSLVGVISSPTQKVTLLPKYSEINLNHVMRIYNYVHGRQSSSEEHVLDLSHTSSPDNLIRQFLESLQRAILAGLPKGYVLSEEKSRYWRGRVSVRKTALNVALRHHNPVNTKVRHLVLDTPLNRIFKVALTKIVKDPEFHFEAGRYLDYLDTVQAPQRSGAELYQNITFTSADTRLKELALRAKMIIDELYVDDLDGQYNGKGFLINFDILFEEFVRKILMMYSPQEFVYWKDMRILGDVSVNGTQADTRVFKPDILFRPQDEDELNRYFTSSEAIVDVKNKANGLFKPADVYQISQYSAMLNAKKALLIYPSFIEKDTAELSIEYPMVPIRKIKGVYINISEYTGAGFLNSIDLFKKKVSRALRN